MSSMTCGVNRKLRPSTCVLRPSFFFVAGCGAGTFFSFAMCSSPRATRSSENEFLFGRLEIVVVPELPTGDDLAHVADAVWRFQSIHLQLALEPARVQVGHLARHGIYAEAGNLAADIDRAVVHG